MTTTTTPATKKAKAKRPAADDASSRERLIEATALLLRRQGYAATGLAQIIDVAGAPRGSLYFHFPGGKEELAAAALERSGERQRDNLRAALDEADPVRAVDAVVDVLARDLEDSGFKDGCPVATVALEVGGDGGALATLCRLSFARWRQLIVDRLRAVGADDAAADDAAWLVFSSLEGAQMMCRVHGTTAPLRAVGRQLGAMLRLLLASGAAGRDPLDTEG